MLKIHCVNVIEPRQPGRRNCTVSLTLVLAESREDAMKLIAASIKDDNVRLVYRNDWEPDETINWTYQYWDKETIETHKNKAVPPRAIAAYVRPA